ncbi:hypothetical protein AGMMS49975_24860 [Clostridia bacterium]|nr:hypothetical protein AGMMS49975_24860 [Clostridia bacterium]
MEDFEFPTNIKQVGSIGGGIKIYVEDYVFSFLRQYAARGNYDERLALLVGRSIVIDNVPVVFISGAVSGEYLSDEDGVLKFTKKSFEHASEQIDRYFRGLEVVGFMHSQPGYGNTLNANYEKYHKEMFKKPYQVVFVVDHIDKQNSFYYYHEKRELAELRGYFIYYEKNDGMHEYMLGLSTKSTLQERPEEITDEYLDRAIEQASFAEDERTKAMDLIKVRKIRRAVSGSGRHKGHDPRRAVGMLTTFSTALVTVCVVMGAGLVQNEGRINTLEGELVNVNTMYKNLLVQMKDQQSKTVFSDITQTETVEEEPEEIPEPEPAPTPEPEEPAPDPIEEPAEESSIPKNYTIQEGDNLSYISMYFYGTNSMVARIMEANNLQNPDNIQVGNVLVLPRP